MDDYRNTEQHAMQKKSTIAGVGGRASNFAEATRRSTSGNLCRQAL